MSQLRGLSLIGGKAAGPGGRSFVATDPATNTALKPEFHEATIADLHRADALAKEAFAVYGRSTGAVRAAFLRQISTEIEGIGSALIDRFVAESGLPKARAESECGRTCAQLRLFASMVENDTWADPRIDHGDAERKPAPKPDTRSLLRPIGPVAVFGPSNFPLAFTVAGGDTVSALAAGCPVIVKAHPSHPGTSELVGHAIVRAMRTCKLPDGVFSLVFGGREIGAALVELPSVRAVGFTGSRVAGLDLLARCQHRSEPIPFFGELSGINPLCILPSALATRGTGIAEGLSASVTLGCGQFCTKPGLIFHIGSGAGADGFREALTTSLQKAPPAAMLNVGIRASYSERLDRLMHTAGVTTLVAPTDVSRRGPAYASAALFSCESGTLRAQRALQEEVFGPATLLVACRDLADMVATIDGLEGQLTATVHEAKKDLATADALLWTLEQKAGRIIFNGYPTGVEVCASMVHGGPWPATTDSRFTSVGTAAIRRFVRPVCYQNMPDAHLPAALRGARS